MTYAELDEQIARLLAQRRELEARMLTEQLAIEEQDGSSEQGEAEGGGGYLSGPG